MNIITHSWGDEHILHCGVRLYYVTNKKKLTINFSQVRKELRDIPKFMKIKAKYGNGVLDRKLIKKPVEQDYVTSIIKYFQD